jgi:hypothetical protein
MASAKLLQRLHRRLAIPLLVGGVLLAVLAPAPLRASASTSNIYWVALARSGAAAPSGQGTSCSHPGFNNPQRAVIAAESQAASSVIKICPGTYAVQVQITTNNQLTLEAANPKVRPELQLPAKPRDSTTNCDKLSDRNTSSPPDQEELVVCGSSSTQVTISGVTIKAEWPHGSCFTNMQGILVAGGSTLDLFDSAVTATESLPDSICELGNEVVDGMFWAPKLGVGHLVMRNDTLSGYNQLGVTASAVGTTFSADNVTVTGGGPTAQQQQTGIQVQYGALGQITHSTISDNICGPHGFRGCAPLAQGVGVIFAGAAHGSFLDYSTLRNNGMGSTYSCTISYYMCDRSWLKSHPDVSFIGDKFTSDPSVDLAIYEGRALGRGNLLSEGQIGYLVFQETGLQYPAYLSSSDDTVRGMTSAAFEVDETQPNYRPDKGETTLTNCKLSGNPGATVATSIVNSSPDYVIHLSGDT